MSDKNAVTVGEAVEALHVANATLRGVREGAAEEIAKLTEVVNQWPGFGTIMTGEQRAAFDRLGALTGHVNDARETVSRAERRVLDAIGGDAPPVDLRDHTLPGLYAKFVVLRNDGSSRPGQKHFECEYFVLDLAHDKHARAAFVAYANACSVEEPQLAADLRAKVEKSA